MSPVVLGCEEIHCSIKGLFSGRDLFLLLLIQLLNNRQTPIKRQCRGC